MSQQKESLLQYQQPIEVYSTDSLGGSRPKNMQQMFDSKLAIDGTIFLWFRVAEFDVPAGHLRSG